MFQLRSKNTFGQTVKGLFRIVKPIQYEERVPTANWSPFFGKYDNQKWGLWDSNSCWKLSQVNCLEDQMEWLWKNGMFSQEAKDFFTKHKYIDADGDFSISERFGEILGGRKDLGGNTELAWQLDQQYGCIPRVMLDYSLERAQKCLNKDQFIADFFNIKEITDEMYILGQEFLKHVSISYQRIGKLWYTPLRMVLVEALKQAPLQISIPVPQPSYLWNTPYVKYDGRVATDHAVELYGIGDDGSYLIFDQYLPNLKALSPDYLIPKVTQGIVNATKPASANPISQDEKKNAFWQGVIHWYNDIFDSIVPIGKV